MTISFSVRRAWRRRGTALSLTALLLFAQLSMAACICPDLSERDLAAGMITPSSNESGLEQDPEQASLCHGHSNDQVALSHIELPRLPPALFTGLVLPLFDRYRALLTRGVAEADGDRLTAPPPRILFCVFRT